MRCAKICFHTDPQASFHITTFSLSTWNVLVDLFITVYFNCELRWKYPSVMSFYAEVVALEFIEKVKLWLKTVRRTVLTFLITWNHEKQLAKTVTLIAIFWLSLSPVIEVYVRNPLSITKSCMVQPAEWGFHECDSGDIRRWKQGYEEGDSGARSQ